MERIVGDRIHLSGVLHRPPHLAHRQGTQPLHDRRLPGAEIRRARACPRDDADLAGHAVDLCGTAHRRRRGPECRRRVPRWEGTIISAVVVTTTFIGRRTARHGVGQRRATDRAAGRVHRCHTDRGCEGRRVRGDRARARRAGYVSGSALFGRPALGMDARWCSRRRSSSHQG